MESLFSVEADRTQDQVVFEPVAAKPQRESEAQIRRGVGSKETGKGYDKMKIQHAGKQLRVN
jgi:hypothetical protein